MDDYRTIDNLLGDAVTRRSISELRLDVVTGGSIEFWSLDKPDSIRGKKYARFIVNEAGFVPNLLDIRNFIITPTLIDMQGDEYYAGTPKGMNGFYALYNQSSPDWMRWQMSSYENPHIPGHAGRLCGLGLDEARACRPRGKASRRSLPATCCTLNAAREPTPVCHPLQQKMKER